MSDENNAVATGAEVASDANQQQQQPRNEGAESAGNDQQENQEGQSQPKEPTKFSRQHKVYLKQQAELRQKQQAFEQERNQHQSQLESERAELAQYRQWQDETKKGNPWAFLKANNLDLDSLYKLALKDEQDPKLVAMNVAKDLEKKFDERFNALEQKRLDEINQQATVRFEGLKKAQLDNATRVLQSDAARFELSTARDDSPEIILHIMAERFQADPNNPKWVNDPEGNFLQAADLLESYLEENEIKDNPVFKTGKAKKYFQDAGKVVVNKDKNQSASRHHQQSERRKQPTRAKQSKPEPRTVTSRMMNATAANARSANETFDKKKSRLFEELRNGTYRPDT